MEELVPITIKVRPDLLRAIESAYRIHGEGRSQFIRNSIAEKLERMGFPVVADSRLVPDRAGVGGQPSHRGKKRAAKTAKFADMPAQGSGNQLNDSPPTKRLNLFEGRKPLPQRPPKPPYDPIAVVHGPGGFMEEAEKAKSARPSGTISKLPHHKK